MRKPLLFGWIAFTACAVAASCGKSSSSSTGSGGTGPQGPVDITVNWTIKGQPASDMVCQNTLLIPGGLVHIQITATLDPSLHQDTTVACSAGRVLFKGLLVEKLGMPLVEAQLENPKMGEFDVQSQTINPMPGAMTVNIDFLSSMSSSVASSTSGGPSSSSTTSGMGGMGGAGGATSSTTSSTSSSTASSTSGAGGKGAGGKGSGGKGGA